MTPRHPDDPVAVVFDFDGTLVSSEDVSHEAMAKVLAEDGHVLTERERSEVVGHAWPHTRAYLVDLMGYDEAGIASYRERVAAAFHARIDDVVLFDDVAAVLDQLHATRVPVAVCTSSGRPYLEGLLERTGIADRFAATVARQDTDEHKPLPAPYLLAAQRLGVDPATCVVVEDTPAGIAAAQAAGMRVVAVDRGLGLDLTAADRVTDRVTMQDLRAVTR